MKEYIKQITRLPGSQNIGNATRQHWHIYFSQDFKGVLVEENIIDSNSTFKISPFGFIPASAAMYFSGGKQAEFLEESMNWVLSLDAVNLKTILYGHKDNMVSKMEMKETPPYRPKGDIQLLHG